jgi:hypothetical protein
MRLVALYITLINDSCGRGLDFSSALPIFSINILILTINTFFFVNLHKVGQLLCTESIFFASY